VAVAVGSSGYAGIVTEDINIAVLLAVQPVITRTVEKLKATTVKRAKASNNTVNRRKDVAQEKRQN
jgi:hypothetical protein